MEGKEISRAVIKRLPRYHRYLDELMEAGVERISSSELSHRMHVTASQIRQDLNHFGGFGQQGYGYNVEFLYREISKILGLDAVKNMVIIGGGNIGQALANFEAFKKRGFVTIGIFDNSPQVIGRRISGVPVMDIAELEAFIESHDVRIAVLTVPKSVAPQIAERVVSCGIRAIWNFAHTDLHIEEKVVIENVHLSDSLMQLSYRLSALPEAENG